MAERLLELLTLASRFWFLFLILLLAWGAFKATRRDFRNQKQLRSALAGANQLGHIKLMSRINEDDKAAKYMQRGYEWVFYRESTVGSARNCDIILRHSSVEKYHARLFAVEGYLACEPGPGALCLANGEQFDERLTLVDGDRLTFGALSFRVTLYDAPLDEDYDDEEEDDG